MSDVGEGSQGQRRWWGEKGAEGMMMTKVAVEGGLYKDRAKPGDEAHLSFHSCNPSNLDY